MRSTVRALIKSIGCDSLTRRMSREAILDSDQLSIDPKVNPYKDMIAHETRWWAYPEARSTRMGKAAVEAKQTAAKKNESRAATAEEAEAQQSSNSDESDKESDEGADQVHKAKQLR